MARARTTEVNGAAERSEPHEPNSDSDLVRQYLNQIATTKLLTASEEVELAKRIEAGVYAQHLLDSSGDELDPARRRELEALARDGQQAKDHMIRANLRLVVSAAKRQLRRGTTLLDLVQDGNLGLIHAVEKFDYQRGYKFSTYAMWWIRQAIDRGLAEQSRVVRLPSHVAEEMAKVSRVERELRPQLRHEPTVEDIAERAGFSPERVRRLQQLGQDAVSLDTPVGEEGETQIGDLIEDPETLSAADVTEFRAFRAELRALVDTLPPREAMIICIRYGLHDGTPRSLQEVAQRLGLTKERIRQLEKEAIAKLRDPERNQTLLAWAG